MKISFTGIKEKAIGKCIVGIVTVIAAVVGISPINVFGQSVEVTCNCQAQCEEENINFECAICGYDHNYCQGAKAKAETEVIEDVQIVPENTAVKNSEVENTEEVVNDKQKFGPLTPDGNMDLVDDYGTEEKSGKQFITVTTKTGKFFYIIIDRDDNGTETVHFLNLVDEVDLMALIDDKSLEKKEEKTPVVEEKEQEIEPETEKPDEKTIKKPKSKSTNVNGIMAIVLVISLCAIGGFLYIKSKKNNKSSGSDPDEDYADEIVFNDDLGDLEDLDDETDEDMFDEAAVDNKSEEMEDEK